MRRIPIIIGLTLILIAGLITRSAILKQAEQDIPHVMADQRVVVPAVEFSSIQNPIVPSLVVDTEAPIFVGTGDGSNGFFYSKKRRSAGD